MFDLALTIKMDFTITKIEVLYVDKNHRNMNNGKYTFETLKKNWWMIDDLAKKPNIGKDEKKAVDTFEKRIIT